MEIYVRDNGTNQVSNTDIVGYQLLLNYCFGHRESTLLLCPYGLLTGLVNHGGKGKANVRLQWSDPKRVSHDTSLLNKTVKKLVKQKSAALAMELVALRDIEEGEEILVDYGEEWEEAWKNHVEAWEPVEGADTYVSAADMNEDLKTPIKTEFEQMLEPYPANLHIKFDLAFGKRHVWMKYMKKGKLMEYKKQEEGELVTCDVLRWDKGALGRIFYTVAYTDADEDAEERHKLINGVPRESLVFKDRAYTGDFHLPNVFRHDMRIPDDIFPDAWKNVDVNKSPK
jgi:hypothetical protein